MTTGSTHYDMGGELPPSPRWRYQIVWWREWRGVLFMRCTGGIALVYDWVFVFGFLEVRRWHNTR